MKRVLAHLELLLTGVGLIVVWLVPALVSTDSTPHWKAMALTSILVGVVHGLIFWLVRRRQRIVRNKTIADVRGMLKDRVNNHLTVILMNAALSNQAADELHDIQQAVGEISGIVETLSEESLQRWQVRYADAAAMMTERSVNV